MFLKRFLVFVLCLMTTTVFANTKNELQSAFQDLNYDLTVEWDQKDKAVLTTKLERFQSVISGLKQKGVTNEEIKTALKGMINNPKLIENLELQASLDLLNDDKNLTEYIWKNRQGMTSQGASWNGTAQAFMVGGLVAIIIAAIIIVIDHVEYICTSQSNYYCEERWTCDVPGEEGEGCQDGHYYDWCGQDCLDGYNAWR